MFSYSALPWPLDDLVHNWISQRPFGEINQRDFLLRKVFFEPVDVKDFFLLDGDEIEYLAPHRFRTF